MDLKKLFELISPQICSGAEYLWKSYGNHARYIDFGKDQMLTYASVVVDTRTQQIYEINVYVDHATDEDGEIVTHKWIDPEYKDALIIETATRYLSVDWIEASLEDALEMITAFNVLSEFSGKGGDYEDERRERRGDRVVEKVKDE